MNSIDVCKCAESRREIDVKYDNCKFTLDITQSDQRDRYDSEEKKAEDVESTIRTTSRESLIKHSAESQKFDDTCI